jgi:hypothetical protein
MPGLNLQAGLGVTGAGMPSNSQGGQQTIASTAYGAGAQSSGSGPRTAGLGSSYLTLGCTLFLAWVYWTLPR